MLFVKVPGHSVKKIYRRCSFFENGDIFVPAFESPEILSSFLIRSNLMRAGVSRQFSRRARVADLKSDIFLPPSKFHSDPIFGKNFALFGLL